MLEYYWIILLVFILAALLIAIVSKKSQNKSSHSSTLHQEQQAKAKVLNDKPYHPNGQPVHEVRIAEIQKQRAERIQQISYEQAEKKHQEELQRRQFLQQETARQEQERIAAEQKEREEYRLVEFYSQRYHQLQEMPARYGIVSGFKTSFTLSYIFRSRRAYDEIKPQNALAYLAKDNRELEDAYDNIKYNRQKLKRFMDENQIIKQSSQMTIRNSGLTEDRFLQIEKELCRKLETKVPVDLQIELYLYYRNGGDHSLKTFNLDYDALDAAYQIKEIPDIEYTSSQEEREKMTPSLRYSILRRDGFRCVLCGATAENGTRLHVDHIMPVSKGGKTEPSNLRTLCDRCNFGKGDKYDPDGLN